jgi:DNA mismatch repair protein MSH6
MAIKSFKLRVFAEFDEDRAAWLRAVRLFAELDCLLSLSKTSDSLEEPRCRPEFVDMPTAMVNFKDLRHPILSALKTDFIPNDVKLGGQGDGRIALLTGPNMA